MFIMKGKAVYFFTCGWVYYVKVGVFIICFGNFIYLFISGAMFFRATAPLFPCHGGRFDWQLLWT